MFTKIAVLGLGRVGRLAAELMSDAGFDVAGFDARPIPDAPFPVHAVDLGDARAMRASLAGRRRWPDSSVAGPERVRKSNGKYGATVNETGSGKPDHGYGL